MMSQTKTQDSLIISTVSAMVIFIILLLFSKSAGAAGLLKPKNGDQSLLELKEHRVSVVINNGFAKTEVDQLFFNTADSDLEAIYSFPVPAQASLSEVSLWIDGKEVVGEVLEKKQAKRVYEEQKAKGNDAALAEKDEYRTFTVSVYPVRSLGDTRVRLVYYQPLAIDLNVGRYVYPLQEGGVDEEQLSFWSVDDKVSGLLSFDLVLKSAHPVKEVRVPGFMGQTEIQQLQSGEGEQTHVYTAKLRFPEGGDLGKDIVFYYRLDDSVPARVELVPYKADSEKQGVFMMTVTPGASLGQITEGVDWTFVLDKSGSMSGAKIGSLVDGVSRALGELNVRDRFRVVAFNNAVEEVTGGFLQATQQNIESATRGVKGIVSGGGTAMYAGLSAGVSGTDSERTSLVVLVTDGVANIGPNQHANFLELLRDRDVRLFTFVMGNSANAPLLERLARVSGGFSMAISSQDDIFGRLLQVKGKILHEALHGVEIDFSGGDITEVSPAEPKSLYRGQQLIVFGRYATPEPVRITLSARISGQQKKWSTEFVLPQEDLMNPEIERMWALSAIENVMDEIRLHGEDESLRKKIVEFGENYSLVTDYTSMVVVNDEEFENYGLRRNNGDRVAKEREAQHQKMSAAPVNFRVDNSGDNTMFNGAPSPGIGSGPVGPVMVLVLCAGAVLIRRRKNQ